ncbi:hypothetical protein LZ30DRAFT_133965 [Colletotrichum cereale]|nr:hypothetical protein LZ30DRAFT_133965 [Colletotrichum cereale]
MGSPGAHHNEIGRKIGCVVLGTAPSMRPMLRPFPCQISCLNPTPRRSSQELRAWMGADEIVDIILEYRIEPPAQCRTLLLCTLSGRCTRRLAKQGQSMKQAPRAGCETQLCLYCEILDHLNSTTIASPHRGVSHPVERSAWPRMARAVE